MARQPEIQYINAYVAGSAAYKIESAPVRKHKKVQLPKQKRAKKTVIAFDPVAIGGILVASVLLVLMFVGMFQLQGIRQDQMALQQYVGALQQENEQLSERYASGYDLEEIERIALAMGMVPSSQVPHINLDVSVPQVVEEPTAWETFCMFLTGLFA